MAFYKYFWDLTNATIGQTHTVGSFDNNTTTGGGTFRWVQSPGGTLPPDIAGMRIRAAGNQGYWERVWEGPLNVSWFGCQNTDAVPYTFGQLGISQATLNKRYGTGTVTVNDCYDTAAIKYAFLQMNNVGWSSIEFEPKNHWLTQTCNLPVNGSGGYGYLPGPCKFIIDGNGAQLLRRNLTSTFDFFKRSPINNTEAQSFYANQSFVIKNFVADYSPGVGSGSFVGAFLRLTTVRDSIIENIHLSYFASGIVLEDAPCTTVNKITCNNVLVPMTFAFGSYAGANMNTTGCNYSEVKNIRLNWDFSVNGFGMSFANCQACIVDNVLFTGAGAFNTGIIFISYNASILGSTIKNINFNAAQNGTDAQLIRIEADGNTTGYQNWIIDTINSTAVPEVLVTAFAKPNTITMQVNLKNTKVPTGSTLFNQINNPLDPLKIGWNLENVGFGPTITTAANVVNVANNLWSTTVGPYTGVYPTVSEVVYTPPILP